MSARTRHLVIPLLAVLICAVPVALGARQADPLTAASVKEEVLPPQTLDEIRHALLRLPLAAALGALLAFRPKRRGTPPRQVAVIQTQIILAVMAAVVMLVVGSNLARAFGVVGAAGLVRYRAKIEDPKDAGVMLSTLAVGLASGVGQYVIAAFSAVFILLVLWVIESFEPEGKKLYELSIKMGDDTDGRRKEFDAVLHKFHVDFTMLTASDEEVSYEMLVPLELDRDRVTNALLKLDPEGHAAVQWTEKKPKTK
ncbi:MAG: MgtC/SapB family protein [Vicinamibacterales bacterium]